MVSIITLMLVGQIRRANLTCREKIEKGRSTSHSIQTQKPSSPIINRLEALLARRQLHPRTPVRSFVGLLTARPLESGATALIVARFDTSPPAASVRLAWRVACGKPPLTSQMIVLLGCGVVNACESHACESQLLGGIRV